MALLLTLIVGLFTVVGSIIVIKTKNSKKIVNFSISIGFGVLTSLILLELIPETIELTNNFLIVIALVALGIILLKLLDIFVPHHDNHEHHHLVHVGIMTSTALFIHNFLEGMTLYIASSSSLKLGLPLAIGIALHNIPLGMSICSMFYNEEKKKNIIIISLIVSLSTFMGGFLTFIFKTMLLSDFVLGIVLSLTLGMLIYIVLFELLPDVISSKDKKTTVLGIIIGILLLVISLFME